jgi:hypothetical protein
MSSINAKTQAIGLLTLASLSLSVWLVSAPEAARAQTKDKKKADLARYVKQMSDQFNTWDLNKDGVLDKYELAKAFRGSDAKAYDYQDPPPKPDVRLSMVALMSLPRAGLPFNAVVADQVTRMDVQKAAKPPPLSPDVYQGYPDYQFIVLAGTKGQDKITKQDFDTWAKNYATAFENRHLADQALKAANAKLAKAKSAKEKKTAEQDIVKHQQELVEAQTLIDLVPPTIQKAMNLKNP